MSNILTFIVEIWSLQELVEVYYSLEDQEMYAIPGENMPNIIKIYNIHLDI